MTSSYRTHFDSFGDDASPLDPGRSNLLAAATKKGDLEGSAADSDPKRVLAERLVSSTIAPTPSSQEVRNKQLSDWKAAKKLLFKGKSTLTADKSLGDVVSPPHSANRPLQRPKPTTSDSFRKLLRRNTQPQPVAPLPSSQVDEEERRLRLFVEQQDQSTVRPSLAVTQEFARSAHLASGLPSIFSPASGEYIPSRSARRTLSNSSLGSGASRIREATSSFLRRLRASRTPSSSVDLTPRPREHPRTHEYDIATVQRPQSTTPSSSSDPRVSRGLYKSSSSASVQSYRGTDDSFSGSSAIYPSSQSNSSYTSAHNLLLGGPTSSSTVSGNRSRGLIHKSSSDLPRIQGSPADESVIEGEQQKTQPLQSDPVSCKPPLYHRSSFVSAKQANGALQQVVHPYSFVEQPPPLRKARSSASISKTHSSTSLEMPQPEKGSSGWRSRFGTSKRDKGEGESPTSSHGALLDRFTLDKKTSQDSMSQATYGRKETQSGKSVDELDEREMAAQHIARQQRAANDARLAEALPIHNNGKQKALKTMPSSTSYSPHSRLEEYRNATRNAGLPTNGRNNSGSNLDHSHAADMDRTSSKGHGSVSRSTSPSVHRANTSSRSSNDEASCPVCLELLSFRLAGEKAHVVPLCGHALHHACFTAVYGAPEVVLAAQQQHSNESAPGMCGVCRRLIVLPEESEARRPGKLAGMMGVENDAKMARTGEQNVSPEVGSSKGRSPAIASGNALYAANDDPLEGGGRAARESRIDSENSQGMPTGKLDDYYAKQQRQQQQAQQQQQQSQQQQDRFMIFPTIKVRPEFETVYLKDRNQATDANSSGRKNVVCVVSVEVPPRRRTSRVEEDEALWQQKSDQYLVERKGKFPEVRANNEDDEVEPQSDEDNASSQPVQSSQSEGLQHDHEDAGEQSAPGSSASGDDEEGFSFSATPAAADSNGMSFASVVDDLRHRIVDWKGHSVDRFGNLVLFDFLGVRQDSVVREFYVYLFKEALLCVNEERKKERGLSRLIPNADRSFGSDEGASGSSGSHSKSNKGAMKLKGRIWLRHIRRCQNLELDDKPCLSIKLDDEALDHFVLCFKDRSTRETWRLKLTRLLGEQKRQKKAKAKKENDSSVALRKTIDEAPALGAAADGSLSSTVGSSSHRSPGDLSQSSHTTRNTSSTSISTSLPPFASPATSQQSNSPHKGTRSGAPLPGFLATLPSHQQWSASGGLDPGAPVPEMLPHTPLDLVIMISVPSVTSHPAVSSSTLSSSAALKLRLIRSTLDFVIANVGPRDRIALVAYNVGVDGLVRRTALLNVAKSKSRERLEQFVDTIGKPWEGPGEDPFREDINRLGGQSDRTDTVTAVNVGFDIVLQRKSRNPTTGMLLINDTADAPKRGQMDLIMARAEAANVPVHCFGFGKSHDPSSLWLISNHTRGSYTFVKEWYQLRECVAGCLGALMSIALTDVKLHISVPSDNHFRVRKVAGCTGSIISSSGKDVDLELGEMRFGECKELFLELELDFTTLLMQHSLHQRSSQAALSSQYEKGSATDDFMQRLGLQGLSIVDSAHDGDGESREGPSTAKSHAGAGSNELDPATLSSDFVDDIAVLEVHCGCRDPNIGVGASRLPDPCVLTLEVDASSDGATTETSAAAGALTAVADPLVTRRRMEILVSDMITRCLLLVSRRNHAQALTILLETRKIVDTVLQSIPLNFDNADSPIRSNGNGNGNEVVPGDIDSFGRRGSGHRSQTQASLYARQTRNSHARKQREMLHRRTAIVLMAILEDLDVLIDGLEAGKSISFERSERNFGAQQAMVLRDQKAWTSRSDTEWQFFKMLDNGPAFAALAAHFAANFGR